MKTIAVIIVSIITSLLVVAGCGMKVGADQETIDAAQCIADPAKCKDGSSSTDTGSDSTDSAAADDSGGSDSADGSGSAVDPHDTSGGVLEPEEYDRDSSASFLGTWSQKASDYDYAWSGQNQKCAYPFPSIIRAYSHEDVIDFENNTGSLQWIARIYPDETFDFGAHFQDRLGRETVTVDCTCVIVDAYYSYSSDEINCTCEWSDGALQCLLYYQKMTAE